MNATSYLPPTGAELRALLRRWELTGAAAAELVHCHPRTVRKWAGAERGMPFAALYTLAARHAGAQIRPEDWRDVLLHPRPDPANHPDWERSERPRRGGA